MSVIWFSHLRTIKDAARAATALEKSEFLVYDMALSFIALVDPQKEEEKERQADKKFV